MTDDRDRPLFFDCTEGSIRHRFFRHGQVAAHAALTSGTTPRIQVAFPTGNRGILVGIRVLASATQETADTIEFGGPIVPLDPKTDGIRGVLVPITADAPEVRFNRAVLGNIRTIRDVGYGVSPTASLSRYAIVATTLRTTAPSPLSAAT